MYLYFSTSYDKTDRKRDRLRILAKFEIILDGIRCSEHSTRYNLNHAYFTVHRNTEQDSIEIQSLKSMLCNVWHDNIHEKHVQFWELSV